MKLPIGISDFAKLKSEDYVLVDKTLLIKDIIDDGAQVLVYTRPRRFGKTLNMSMLQYYFGLSDTDNSHLFKDLKIWQQGQQYQAKQGKYPVIFLTLKAVKFNDFDSAVEEIALLVRNLFEQFSEVLSGSKLSDYNRALFERLLNKQGSLAEIRNSLKFLMQCIHEHYQIKPIVLIDEYDNPIHSSFIHGYYKSMVNFMQHFLGEAFKNNPHLHKGIITGILRVAKESIFSGLNNLVVYTVIQQKYVQHFGFSQAEVNDLLAKTGLSKQQEQIRNWYNGYCFGELEIYNPWSILNYLNQEQLNTYWVNTSDNALINKILLESASLTQAQFEQLLQSRPTYQLIENDIVFADIVKRPNALWNFLLHTGYLTVTNITQDTAGFFHGDFTVPNKEVALLYRTLIIRWFGTENTPSSNKIAQYLVNGDIDNFQRLLGKFLTESFSYFDTQGKQKEQIYHVFVLGLIAHLSDYYFIKSNREAGDGRYDVVMIPKDKNRVGIIFEFKALDKGTDDQALQLAAQQALKQIQDNDYLAEFKQAGIKKVLQLGLAFAGKKFAVESTNK